MYINEVLKITGILLLIITAAFLQVSFTILEVNQVSPNFVFILTILFAARSIRGSNEPELKHLFVAAGGGLLLDIFSGLPLGLEALMLVLAVLIVRKVYNLLEGVNFLNFIVVFLVLLTVYQIILNFLSLGILDLSWTFLFYNFLLATLFYSLCFLITTLKER